MSNRRRRNLFSFLTIKIFSGSQLERVFQLTGKHVEHIAAVDMLQAFNYPLRRSLLLFIQAQQIADIVRRLQLTKQYQVNLSLSFSSLSHIEGGIDICFSQRVFFHAESICRCIYAFISIFMFLNEHESAILITFLRLFVLNVFRSATEHNLFNYG